MRRCILHIGMHKTGSSSIQASLNNFASKDFRYARLLKTPNHSGAISHAFAAPENSQWKIRRQPLPSQRNVSTRVKQRLDNQLKRIKANTLIISGEGTLALQVEELKDLKRFINRHIDDIEIIAYVRSPKSYIESWFQQLVKAKYVGSSEFNVAQSYPSYRERFEKFEQVFGASSVQYWRFSPEQFAEGCVVKDFCTRIGIRSDIDVRRANEGLSRSAIAVLFAYRKYYGHLPDHSSFNRENKLLVEKVNDLSGGKLRFSSKLIEPILDEHRDDIYWMESRLQASLTEDIFKHDDYAVTTEEDLLSFSHSTVDWLVEQVGADCLRSEQTKPEQVAALIHQLQNKLTGRAAKLGLVSHSELESKK